MCIHRATLYPKKVLLQSREAYSQASVSLPQDFFFLSLCSHFNNNLKKCKHVRGHLDGYPLKSTTMSFWNKPLCL